MALRVLSIDDEPQICDFVREIALDAGCEVVAAKRPEEFKAAFAEAGADVILLDLTIPGTDGIELLQYLAEVGARARILIVSGYDEDIRRLAYTIGVARGLDMAGVLPKPVRAAELKRLLTQFKLEKEEPICNY